MKNDKSATPKEWTKLIGKDTKKLFFFIVIAAVFIIGLILSAMLYPFGGGTIYRPCGRIVVCSDENNPNGVVSSTFERARFFIIYDLASKKFKSIRNPYFNETSPGDMAAQLIANKAEEAVITGNIGPAAYQAFDNFNIHVYLVHRTTVRNAVKLFLQGKLVHVEPRIQFGMVNNPMAMGNNPMGMPNNSMMMGNQPIPIQMQAGAFNPIAAPQIACPRKAFCPTCGLNMPIGSHIGANNIMCPYCPGQSMQIMANAPMTQPAQMQQAGFGFRNNQIPGTGVASRGVCVLR